MQPADSPARREHRSFLLLLAVCLALLAARLFNYLLFHSLAELYSIVIAATFFSMSWHTRRLNESRSLAALGVVYGFVAVLDLFHTLSFPGMSIFTDYDYYANQVWVLARGIEAGGLLVFSFLKLKKDSDFGYLILGLGALSAAGLASIFVFKVFPVCFVAGQGQTAFKVAAELAIIATLAAAALVLRARKRLFAPDVRSRLLGSALLTILSELSFMVYLHNYDWLNLLGHLLKIASFYLLYRAIVVTGLERPHELLYARLKAHEAELAKSNDALTLVISILSHDLRGPLSAIANLAEHIVAEDAAWSPAERGEALRGMGSAAGNSLALVDRVLSWAQLQNGRMEVRLVPLAIDAIVDEQLALLAENIRSKELSVERAIPAGAAVLADREMAGVVLRNLLQNAIKFTARGGRIRLGAEQREAMWRIGVEDSGVGMAEAELAKLFKLDARMRGIGTEGERGTGFGLMISREFAEKMGGRLHVRSELGSGSTFSLDLPRAP